MTRPSKGGEVLLIIFGLIFAAAGLFFATSLLFGAPGQVSGNRWVGVLVSTILIFVGGGIVCAVIYGPAKYRSKRQLSRPIPSLRGCGGRTGRRAEPRARTAIEPPAFGWPRFL